MTVSSTVDTDESFNAGSILVDTLVLQDYKDRSIGAHLGPIVGPVHRNKRSGYLRLQRCYYCDKPGSGTVDHVMPRALGGSSLSSNCVPACRECNEEKQNYHPAVWLGLLLRSHDVRAFAVATLLTEEQIIAALPKPYTVYHQPIQCWLGLD